MNEEEKKAIEKFGRLLKGHFDEKVKKDDFLTLIEGEVLLNLIEKQQKEIEHWKKGMEIVEKDKQNHIDRLERQIDLMAEQLVEAHGWFYSEFDNYTKDDFIKYFKNKAEEGK